MSNDQPTRVESYLNSLHTDQMVMNITLRVLLRNMIRASSNPQAVLDTLRHQVMAAVDAPSDVEQPAQDDARQHQMMKMTAEEMFSSLAMSLGLDKTKRDPSASN